MKRIQLLILPLLLITACNKPAHVTPVVPYPYASITVDAVTGLSRTSNSVFIDTNAGDNNTQNINVAISYDDSMKAYEISVFSTGAFYISFYGYCSTDTGVYYIQSCEYYQITPPPPQNTEQYTLVGFGTNHITQDSSGINGTYSFVLRSRDTGYTCGLTGTISVVNRP